MGFSNIGAFACRALQQNLVDYYGANTAELKTMGSTSLLRYLTSPQNVRGFKQIADGVNTAVPGKQRAVAFQLDTPMCFDICSIADVDCNTERVASTPLSQEIVFDFDNSAPYRLCDDNGDPVRIEFTKAQLKRYCTETDTSYITRQIARVNRRFIEALDKRVGEVLETKVGKSAAGDSVTSLPFFLNLTTGQQTLNPEAFYFLDQLYSDIGGEGQYGLVGGNVLKKIIQYQKWANLGDSGIDLGLIDDINPFSYFDRFLNSTLGINQFFQLSPGAVQFVPFVENIGENNREVTDLYTHSTVIDPVTGIEFDFEWYWEPHCKVWTYEPFLAVELAVAPPGGCGIPDSNGVLLINDCSHGATPPECPDSASA